MNDISPYERLQRVLVKKTIDRPPVICPGGMMNSATVEVMTGCGQKFPAVHRDADCMAELAAAVQRQTGFENFGIPFCMTVEAEVLGSEINFGTLSCEPKIQHEAYASVRDVVMQPIPVLLHRGRIDLIANAGSRVAHISPDIPVIGSLTGPISTAASLVDPMNFLKELQKDKSQAHHCLSYVTDFLVAYARVLVESGFRFITIADPTATGEILGPRLFKEYAVPYLNQLADAIHDAGAQVIIHICGRMAAVKKNLPDLHSDAISTDAVVNLSQIKAEYPMLTVMGNMSTFALQEQKPAAISRRTEDLLAEDIQIIAPACGLSTQTPLVNIRAMTETVRGQ